jgi:hypothetical protein
MVSLRIRPPGVEVPLPFMSFVSWAGRGGWMISYEYGERSNGQEEGRTYLLSRTLGWGGHAVVVKLRWSRVVKLR